MRSVGVLRLSGFALGFGTCGVSLSVLDRWAEESSRQRWDSSANVVECAVVAGPCEHGRGFFDNLVDRILLR